MSFSETERNFLLSKGIKILEIINRGSFGEVYAIAPYKGEENLCIKFIKNTEKCINEEYLTAKNLYDKFPDTFAKVLEIIKIRNEQKNNIISAAIVMEKLEPIDRVRLRNNNKSIIKLLFESSVCLAYMHILNKTHRDIKLDNILYSERLNRYVLIDFGITTTLDETINEDRCIGSFNNIAPESLKGIYSKKSDFYALGMCIRQILVGNELREPQVHELHIPYNEHIYKQKKDLRPLNKNNYSCPELIKIVNKLTEFNRNDRYKNYESLSLDLVQLCDIYLNDTETLMNAANSTKVSENSKNIYIIAYRPRDKLFSEEVEKIKDYNIQTITYSETLSIDSHDKNNCVNLHCKGNGYTLIDSIRQAIKKVENCYSEDYQIHILVADSNAINPFKRMLFSSDQLLTINSLFLSDNCMLDISSINVSEILIANKKQQFINCINQWF